MLRNSLAVTIVAMVDTSNDTSEDSYINNFACKIANDSEEDATYASKPCFKIFKFSFINGDDKISFLYSTKEINLNGIRPRKDSF